MKLISKLVHSLINGDFELTSCLAILLSGLALYVRTS